MEGLCQGIDEELVTSQSTARIGCCNCGLTVDFSSELGEWATIPCTYAGGAKCKDAISGRAVPLIGLIFLSRLLVLRSHLGPRAGQPVISRQSGTDIRKVGQYVLELESLG